MGFRPARSEHVNIHADDDAVHRVKRRSAAILVDAKCSQLREIGCLARIASKLIPYHWRAIFDEWMAPEVFDL